MLRSFRKLLSQDILKMQGKNNIFSQVLSKDTISLLNLHVHY